MPQKVLKFNGINRKVNEFLSSGGCEELINLRPTSVGLEVVKPKVTKFTSANYDVYHHEFGDKSVFIGITQSGDTVAVNVINEDGSLAQLDSFGAAGEYSVAFAGNQMLVSKSTLLRVYEYKDSKYKRVDAVIPSDLNVTYAVESGYGYSGDITVATNPNNNEFKEAIQEHWSAALGQNNEKEAIFGPVMVAFNYSLSDGTEFWTNKWIYVNPYIHLPNLTSGRHMVCYEDGSTKKVVFDSYKLAFTIGKVELGDSDVDNKITGVNVYASRPLFPFNIDTMSAATSPSVHDREIYATAVGMGESGISKQLLYFQKNISIDELKNGNVRVTLDFGEGQAGEKVLEIDNGPVRRTGKMVSYNNRLHFYDSNAVLYPQSVVCRTDYNGTFENRDAYVYIEANGETIVMQTSVQIPLPSSSNVAYKVCCAYPDARATKILIAQSNGNTFFTIKLKPSERYNYAYGEGKDIDNVVYASGIHTTSNVIREANAINVSAPYNPFVFPVEYSYSFGGRILDVATSYLPISSTQIGQYPLTVFTTSGIYAMEQGSGGTLYGNVLPIQPMVIDSKAAPTPAGTFFVSSNSLYILAGREAANVSQILNGGMETSLRENAAYKALVLDDASDYPDFSERLSSVEFEQFVSGADLVYDQFRNELFISKDGYGYSYVFSLDTKSFHKVSRRYVQGASSARYVVEQSGARLRVVDLHNEYSEPSPILLQSRPFSLEALSTHIQRMILYVDAKISGSQGLFLTVFASDNLNDWDCVISSQKANVILRQIRTNKAARSYRDYIVMISGFVGTDTDIADIIADYTVVNRRLG